MFHDSQVQSYKRITAPADLKQKTLAACENVSQVKTFTFPKAIYGLAPLAACLLLCFLLLPGNKNTDKLLLQTGDLQLSSYSETLPQATSLASVPRMISAEAPQYTITLTGNQTVEIVSADGLAVLDENGNIVWTVEIPYEDTDFELYLSAGEVTYYVPLTYHAQDGSFSIRYEAK